jgi:hypothetical protein
MISLLVDLHQAGGDTADLVLASKLAGWGMMRQHTDGTWQHGTAAWKPKTMRCMFTRMKTSPAQFM